MHFRQSHQFRTDLEDAVAYYAGIDSNLAGDILDELEAMEKHLADFPEASPMTSEPPVRKFLLKRFPYRVRYSLAKDQIILLTLENMSKDKPL
jgi:hypothetical protein